MANAESDWENDLDSQLPSLIDVAGDLVSEGTSSPFDPSTKGNKYFLVIADNAGNDTRIYLSRTATGKVVQERMALYFTNKNPKTVRMDNASHFKNAYVLDFLEGVGAQVIFSIPYKPENKLCGREGSA